jgi:hypothetical protein
MFSFFGKLFGKTPKKEIEYAKNFMPKELKDKWIAALRSGEYTQSTGCMQTPEGHCVLGVLQMVADGKVQTDTCDQGDMFAFLPTVNWLKEHNISFIYNGSYRSTPVVSYKEKDEDGTEFTRAMSLTYLNDVRHDFNELADIIEAQIEGV